MGCALLVACGSAVIWAGEPIQITKSPEKVDLPKDPAKDVNLPQGLFNSRVNGGESSQGPVLPAPSTPVLLSNPKLEELLRQKKNWLEAPNGSDHDQGQAIEQIFGIRKYELNNGEKRSKGDLERIYDSGQDERGGKGSRSAKDRSSREGATDRSDKGNSPSGPGDGDANDPRGIIPELNPAYLFNWTPQDSMSQFGGAAWRSSFLPRPMEDPIFGQRSAVQPGHDVQQQGARDIEKLWNAQKAPLGRINDPINVQADVTRAIINPISAMKASAPPPVAPQPALSSETTPTLGSIAPPLSARSEAFTFGGDKSGASSMFSPPAASAARGPSIQPKPAMLEIPRPKL
jgi:hypothetical protein